MSHRRTKAPTTLVPQGPQPRTLKEALDESLNLDGLQDTAPPSNSWAGLGKPPPSHNSLRVLHFVRRLNMKVEANKKGSVLEQLKAFDSFDALKGANLGSTTKAAVHVLSSHENYCIKEQDCLEAIPEMEAFTCLSEKEGDCFIKCFGAFYFENSDSGRVILILQRAKCDVSHLQEIRGNYEMSKTMLIQCLKGLQIMHSAHLIHNDIKPGNVLVIVEDQSFRFVLADFGSVKKITFDKTGERLPLAEHGTPFYADYYAELRGSQTVDGAGAWLLSRYSDVYSLALTALQLIGIDITRCGTGWGLPRAKIVDRVDLPEVLRKIEGLQAKLTKGGSERALLGVLKKQVLVAEKNSLPALDAQEDPAGHVCALLANTSTTTNTTKTMTDGVDTTSRALGGIPAEDQSALMASSLLHAALIEARECASLPPAHRPTPVWIESALAAAILASPTSKHASLVARALPLLRALWAHGITTCRQLRDTGAMIPGFPVGLWHRMQALTA